MAIARVLVQDPDVILADEPVSAVDPTLAQAIVALLRDLSAASRKTLLVNLHSVELALAHFPRIVGIRDGRMLFDLPPAAGFRRIGRRRLDHFERESLAFHRRVRRGYLEIHRAEPKRVRLVRADRPVAAVAAEVRAIVADFLRHA